MASRLALHCRWHISITGQVGSLRKIDTFDSRTSQSFELLASCFLSNLGIAVLGYFSLALDLLIGLGVLLSLGDGKTSCWLVLFIFKGEVDCHLLIEFLFCICFVLLKTIEWRL